MKDQTMGNEEIFPHYIKKVRTRKRCHDEPVKTCTACILCGYNLKNVSYHRFPTDSTRNEWLRICELPGSTDTRNLKVCGRHFAADVKLIRSDGSMSLKKAAIPTLNLEVYGLNGDDSEDPVEPVPHEPKSQNTIKRLPSESIPLPKLNLAELQNSVKRALHFSSPVLLDAESKRNSDLQSCLGGELVEVVEMKIYRFNSPPALKETSLSDITIEMGTNGLDDDSENLSHNSAHIKGLQMHSYSKPVSEEKPIQPRPHYDSLKRVKAVRYFGDLTEDDYATPENAKHSWTIARRVIEKKNEKILRIETENEVLQRKLKNLKELLFQLRTNWSIPNKFRKRSQTSVSESHTDHEVIVLD